jgi:hypothetical protein
MQHTLERFDEVLVGLPRFDHQLVGAGEW